MIEEHISLKPYTTFGIGGPAEFFVSVDSVEKLKEAVSWANTYGHPITILGGGSNVLVADEGVQGLVIVNEIKNTTYKEDEDDVLVEAGGGHIFDLLVAEAASRDLWGLENLSAIPGTVGASPIQNIGAYGTEVSSCIEKVFAYDSVKEIEKVFTNKECAFAYRDSFFKKPEGKKYIVTSVVYRLSKKGTPNCSYKDLKNYFGEKKPTLSEVRSAVIDIRSKKFPDWTKEGTAGSFFKNPIVTEATYSALQEKYPEIPGFFTEKGDVKIPLGWILDVVLKLKGTTNKLGTVGTYQKQALVIVNKNGATKKDVDMFAEEVVQKVFDATGITVEREVTDIT